MKSEENLEFVPTIGTAFALLDIYKFVSSLGRWRNHSTYHMQRAEVSVKKIQGGTCLCNGNCHATVLTASLACRWFGLKKYVLWRSIKERLISRKEVLSTCTSPEKVCQNSDRDGPGVWAECEAGLLQGVQTVLSDSRSFLLIFRESSLNSFLNVLKRIRQKMSIKPYWWKQTWAQWGVWTVIWCLSKDAKKMGKVTFPFLIFFSYFLSAL